MSKVKVIIADDSAPFIEGLRAMFALSDKYEILEIYSNGKDLTQSDCLHRADILLIDIEMPEMNGIQAAKLINYEHSSLVMVAITMYKDKVYLEDIIKAGFRGFVHKPDIVDNLFVTLEKALNNQFVFNENMKVK